MTVPRALADDLRITGVWAVLGGTRFKSTRIKPNGTVRLGYTGAGFPGHDAFRFDETANAWIAVVPATECDGIAEIAHQAGYRGHRCDVAEIDDTGVGLYLVRGDDATADELGFQMRERGVYWKFVDLADLDYYEDVHKDVFFPYWQQITFGFAPNAGNWERYAPDPDLPEVGYDRFPHDPDVTVLANHHGTEYRVAAMWPGGTATLHPTSGDGPELQAHIGTLYNYRQIHRDRRFDQWLAEHRG